MKIWSKSNFLLYAAYTSACLEDRAWSYCVSLCMILFGGMQLVSIEQLSEGLMQMAFSGNVGRYFDTCTRKRAIQTVVPLNNLTIAMAACCFVVCLSINLSSVVFPILLVTGMVMCSINRLFLNAEKFIVGRDWTAVMGKENKLADLNAILTTLDQLANVFSPVLTGLLVQWTGLRNTCIIFGSSSLFLMMAKAFFLRTLYRRELSLHNKQQPENSTLLAESTEKKSGNRVVNLLKALPNVISIYYKQTVFLAALGMALLFMTVLGFDGLALGYGQSIGLPDSLLGGFRSFGSAMGIAGALSYAFFEKRFGLRRTGLIGLTAQQFCLILAVISIWLPGSPMNLKGYFSTLTFQSWWDELKTNFNGNTNQTYSNIDWKHFTADGNSMASIFTFLIGISMARFGLWMADLSIMHIIQVAVAESQRNTVFGVHNALCQTFSVLKDLMVIVLPDPATFAICIIISYLFVLSGYICYICYLIKHPSTNSRVHSELSVERQLEEHKDDKKSTTSTETSTTVNDNNIMSDHDQQQIHADEISR